MASLRSAALGVEFGLKQGTLQGGEWRLRQRGDEIPPADGEAEATPN